MLADRNGSGKSSIFAAIALALRGDRYTYRVREDFDGWVRHGARRAHIGVQVQRHTTLDLFDWSDTAWDADAAWDAESDSGSQESDGPAELELGLDLTVSRGKTSVRPRGEGRAEEARLAARGP